MSAPDELRQLARRFNDRARTARNDHAADMRAAAVALRHHANLLDTNIVDENDGRWEPYLSGTGPVLLLDGVDVFRSTGTMPEDEAWTLTCRVAGALNRRIRLAAAAVSPPPTQTCPTCGSDDPEACGAAYYDEHHHVCPDSWHQAAT